MTAKKIFLSFFICILFAGCIKNQEGCTPQNPSVEKPQMIAYCNTHNIQYLQVANGLFYEIIEPGTGVMPTGTSKIFVTYTAQLLDGSIIESQLSPNTDGWQLNSLIEGWKTGIPLIKKGGRIKLVIPSALAYNCLGKGPIPSNSPLFYDITLADVQ